MILQQIKNIKSGKKELRAFGFVMAVVLGIIGGFLWWRGSEYYLHLLAVAVFFAAAGLILPIVLYPVHKVWMTLSVILGWFMTRLILALLYYLVFAPVGLIARLFGKKFLLWQFDANAESYWVPKEKAASTQSDFERQF